MNNPEPATKPINASQDIFLKYQKKDIFSIQNILQ